MPILDVIKYGHPTLRKKAEDYKVEEIDQQFVEDMIVTMREEDGVGLAAPQVNVSKQMLVATDFENIYVLINPKIVAYSERHVTETEACLSLPGLQGSVARYEKIVVKALDRHAKPVEIKANGFFARVLQHEIDHLNGVLYIDRADPDSIVWVDAADAEQGIAPKSAGKADIEMAFKKHYNQDVEELVFESV